jgi:hypothetical protein
MKIYPLKKKKTIPKELRDTPKNQKYLNGDQKDYQNKLVANHFLLLKVEPKLSQY